MFYPRPDLLSISPEPEGSVQTCCPWGVELVRVPHIQSFISHRAV